MANEFVEKLRGLLRPGTTGTELEALVREG